MDFSRPHFAEPEWLWLAFLGPVLLGLLFAYAARARRRQLAALVAPALTPSLLASHSPRRRALKQALLILALVGLGIALARPQWGQTAEVSRVLGEDILFVLDSSRSMLATDVQPSRLKRAQFAILDFVQRHGRGRVGLVAFSGQAFLQCPLTFDYNAFREALLAVDERSIPVPGTDVGRALDEAFKAMEKNDRRKILVLVTDGEDLEKSGVTTARQLAAQGMVVFTVGVGTPAGAQILARNEQGVMEVVRDPSGQPVLSRLDEQTLREIAAATHGAYTPLGPLGEGLNRVRSQVEHFTAAPNVAKIRKMGVDRFHVPVAVIVVLLTAETLIGTRRRRPLPQPQE